MESEANSVRGKYFMAAGPKVIDGRDPGQLHRTRAQSVHLSVGVNFKDQQAFVNVLMYSNTHLLLIKGHVRPNYIQYSSKIMDVTSTVWMTSGSEIFEFNISKDIVLSVREVSETSRNGSKCVNVCLFRCSWWR